MDGFLVINKPKGWTSFDVVAKIRNKLGVKKVGHTGTLDPMATGVLVLCLGKATKMAQEMTGYDKEYVAEITLGTTSNTDDAEGLADQILILQAAPARCRLLGDNARLVFERRFEKAMALSCWMDVLELSSMENR